MSVAPVALMPALPAIAAPNPDAELLAFIDRWQAHRIVLQTATEAMWDAEDRRRDIAVPDAMFERERDIDLFDRTYAQRYDQERCWYPPEGTGHRYLRSIAGLMERHGCHGKNAVERQERAKEILDAIAAYSADRALADASAGLM